MTMVDDLAATVERVAGSVAREYPGVEKDDISQELFLFILGNEQYLKPEEEAGTRYILYRAAHIYARKERAAQLHWTSQYNYRPDDVRRVLETVFSEPEAWPQAPVPDDFKSLKDSMDGLDIVLDIQLALAELDYEDLHCIVDRYRDGNVPANGSATRKRLDRAVSQLVEQMNSHSGNRMDRSLDIAGHAGSRRVISNAHAMAITGKLTDGD